MVLKKNKKIHIYTLMGVEEHGSIDANRCYNHDRLQQVGTSSGHLEEEAGKSREA